MKVNGYRPTYRQSPQAAFQLDTRQLDPAQLRAPEKDLMSAVEELARWTQGEQIRQGQVRWHPEVQTLRVFAEPNPAIPEFIELLRSVLKDWSAASQGRLTLQLSLNTQDADLVLRWSDTPTLGREFEVGHTHRSLRGGKWIQQAEITLLRSPAIDQRLNVTRQRLRLRATLLHEIGHALGLEHSGNPADVMHHRGWKNTALSRHDIERLQALYRQGNSLGLYL